jgi:hypothetical protein
MSVTWCKESSTVETNEVMKTTAHRSESCCWRQLLSLLSDVLMPVLTQLVCGRPYPAKYQGVDWETKDCRGIWEHNQTTDEHRALATSTSRCEFAHTVHSSLNKLHGAQSMRNWLSVDDYRNLRFSWNSEVHQRVHTSMSLDSWTLSWAKSIKYTTSHPISLKCILISSTHASLGIANGLLSSGFQTKFLYAILFSAIHVACRTQLRSVTKRQPETKLTEHVSQPHKTAVKLRRVNNAAKGEEAKTH